MPVAIITVALSSVSSLAAGPATLALVSAATRRRWGQVALIAALDPGAAQAFSATSYVADANAAQSS